MVVIWLSFARGSFVKSFFPFLESLKSPLTPRKKLGELWGIAIKVLLSYQGDLGEFGNPLMEGIYGKRYMAL